MLKDMVNIQIILFEDIELQSFITSILINELFYFRNLSSILIHISLY